MAEPRLFKDKKEEPLTKNELLKKIIDLRNHTPGIGLHLNFDKSNLDRMTLDDLKIHLELLEFLSPKLIKRDLLKKIKVLIESTPDIKKHVDFDQRSLDKIPLSELVEIPLSELDKIPLSELEERFRSLEFISSQLRKVALGNEAEPLALETKDIEAQGFWHEHFGRVKTVNLHFFAKFFLNYLDSTRNIKNVDNLVNVLYSCIVPNTFPLDKDTTTIDVEQFKNALRRFGPMRKLLDNMTTVCKGPKDVNKKEEEKDKKLDSINCSWFRPWMTRVEAENELRKPGVPFIVRYPSASTEDFVCSIRWGNSFQHRLIRNEPTGFQLVLLDEERDAKPPKPPYPGRANIVDVLINDIKPLIKSESKEQDWFSKTHIEDWQLQIGKPGAVVKSKYNVHNVSEVDSRSSPQTNLGAGAAGAGARPGARQ